MKLERLEEFINFTEKIGLTPNEYVSLYYTLMGKTPPKSFNQHAYTQLLTLKKYISPDGKLTPESRSLFSDGMVSMENVERYRQMWPAIILPSGKSARSSVRDLEPRFKWFFENYEYSWDDIYKATTDYITYYAERNYNYMTNCGYFIYKQEVTKLRTSTLAEWCEKDDADCEAHGFDLNI